MSVPSPSPTGPWRSARRRATRVAHALADARTPRPRPASPAHGITLLEVLVTLSLAAILVGVGLPALEQVVAGAERTSAVNELVTALHLARREAVKRGEHAVLCRSAGGNRCRLPSDAAGWDDGLMVFVDLSRDQPPQRDADEPVLLRRAALAGVSVTANRDAFVMRPLHRRATNGTFTVCDRRGADHARALVVSYTGRPRVLDSAPDGDPLECEED